MPIASLSNPILWQNPIGISSDPTSIRACWKIACRMVKIWLDRADKSNIEFAMSLIEWITVWSIDMLLSFPGQKPLASNYFIQSFYTIILNNYFIQSFYTPGPSGKQQTCLSLGPFFMSNLFWRSALWYFVYFDFDAFIFGFL